MADSIVNHSVTQKGSRKGFRVILLLSLLSMEIVVLVGGTLLKSWETASADILMTWRYMLTPDPETLVNPEIVVLSIDTKTQNRMGRFPAGKWLSREAYSDQLSFFDNFLHPTVLAYDIVFQDIVGDSIRGSQDVNSSSEKLLRVMNGLKRIANDPNESLDDQTLYDMNSFALEQGNLNMAHRMASISENKRFHPVIGYYFRTQAQHSKDEKVNGWTDQEIFGSDKTGDESKGTAIPYILDISIPADDIHFSAHQKYDYQGGAMLPSSELLDYSMLGFLNAPPDADGIMRMVPLVLGFKYYNSIKHVEKKVFVPSFALMACILHFGLDFPLATGAVEVYLGHEIIIHSPSRGDIHVPIDGKGRMYLNFTAKFNDFNAVSFADVAPSSSGTSKEFKKKVAQVYRDRLNGRMIMAGINSAGLDIGPCPIEARSPLMIVHLTAVNNILNREFVRPLHTMGKFIMWGCLFVAFSIVCLLEKTARLGFATLLFAVLYVIVAFACICRSWAILPIINPLIYIAVCSLMVLSYRFLAEEKARRRIRDMFSTMVSDQVLSYLEENPGSFSLRGHNVEATVLFSDVVNFTGISERLSPERLTELLNRYLTPATDLILNHGGYVDKYVGDGIMAVWGAPYPDPDHALKACLSAMRQQEMLLSLNQRLVKEFGIEISVRMGLNSGTVKAGNMGSERKFQYTVIGDIVNLASRLEPTNKDFGTKIIIGDVTNQMVKGKIITRHLGKIIVVGKEDAVSIYEVIGEHGKVEAGKLEVISLYETALKQFYSRSWHDCIVTIDSILKIASDGPSVHLRRRAEYYQLNPPDADWQGEYIRSEKN
ncbi:MAG: adenylate/guanylate cyclase domain-containing protein [Kiritimatiellae bacterium]|nr:adenylate/guanylate cyclase domain-containing protein [Kiritimatiellia bacterium]MDD5521234.1 adenylate/guanylate cyclase domain-containing protein [Kiritimatiellia bacterium]